MCDTNSRTRCRWRCGGQARAAGASCLRMRKPAGEPVDGCPQPLPKTTVCRKESTPYTQTGTGKRPIVLGRFNKGLPLLQPAALRRS